MAAVFCASFSRRAMVWRSLVMRTRSSRAASSAGDGARARRAGSSDRIPDRLRHWRRLAMASSTSPFSTWPRLPEPATWSADERCCSRRRAWPPPAPARVSSGPSRRRSRRSWRLLPWPSAAGRRGAPRPSPLPAVGGRRRLAAGLGGGFAPAPSEIEPSSAPTPTVSPSLAAISGERAGGRRRYLDRHLVGFQLDQRLVGGDRRRRPS